MSELPKTFDPRAIETRWYEHWEREGLFRPDRPDAEPWTIVMPPPNVTGSLHIGHALDNTLQDILTRRERMLGKDALWVVGTDHAGIATQMVVERNLASQGVSRAEIGREAFLEHVWEWKAQSGGAITRQLRRLGASCDWSHERFTMDEGYQRAVVHTFVELWKRKLLYRDKRLVNWDPKFQSAISDLEVETKDVQGKFWTLRYPLEDGSGAIQVATTRPETMLADMAVAVHPDDDRYKSVIGKKVKHPITGRLIPVITDEHADPELGSGAVKITPGHDFNDFEVGKRAGFAPADMLNMFDAQAFVVQTQDGLIPEELLGLSREDARTRVVEMLEAERALVSVEDRVIPTPFGDRSGTVIEPWLTDQWYVDVKPLAERVIKASRAGKIKVVPKAWEKTWYNWLKNIQPWCVSRQLWWGHRIPAWYGAQKQSDGSFKEGREQREVFVGVDENEVRSQAQAYYGDDWEIKFSETPAYSYVEGQRRYIFEASNRKIAHLQRDPDVLDTWFSSALWPFATLGWPDETEDLKRHYPNDVLISGFDILFFWDARMAMQGIEFMGEVPWRTLYLHGLVRDALGQKMSKSKGNTVDPLILVDKYGADAMRFTLAAMESQGRDIKLDEKRVEGYRNFATKLWNAARFLQMNGVKAPRSDRLPNAKLAENRWIIGELTKTVRAVNRAYGRLRFDQIAYEIYHFVWHTFCDWYLELIKGSFESETKRVAAWAFDQILVILHPLMPFITEEIWHAMGPRDHDLIVAKWPRKLTLRYARSRQRINWVKNFISEVRAVRAELNVPWSEKLSVFIDSTNPELLRRFLRNAPAIVRMARISDVTFRNLDVGIQLQDGSTHRFQTWANVQKGGAQFEVGQDTFVLNLEGIIDLEAEKARLSKAVTAAEKERDSLAARLANPNFVERAKPEAVEKARSDHAEKSAEAERYRAALERLG